MINSEFVAGCDGDRGVSRAAIPSASLTRYAHEYGYAWLTILAEVAVIRYQEHDSSLLDSYSSTCLRHVWNYQAYATWLTELVHNSGDTSYHGEFRRQVARAEMERLFEPGAANRRFGEFITGLN